MLTWLLSGLIEIGNGLCGFVFDAFGAPLLRGFRIDYGSPDNILHMLAGPAVVPFLAAIQFAALAILILIIAWKTFTMMAPSQRPDETPLRFYCKVVVSILLIFLFYTLMINFVQPVFEAVRTYIMPFYNQAVAGGLAQDKAFNSDVFYDAAKSIETDNSTTQILFTGVVALVLSWKLLFEFIKCIGLIVERYVIAGVLFYLGPLAMSAFAAKSTAPFFIGYMKTIVTQFLIVILNFFFFGVLMYVLIANPEIDRIAATLAKNGAENAGGLLILAMYLMILVAWCKASAHIEGFLRGIGLSPVELPKGQNGGMIAAMLLQRGIGMIRGGLRGAGGEGGSAAGSGGATPAGLNPNDISNVGINGVENAKTGINYDQTLKGIAEGQAAWDDDPNIAGYNSDKDAVLFSDGSELVGGELARGGYDSMAANSIANSDPIDTAANGFEREQTFSGENGEVQGMKAYTDSDGQRVGTYRTDQFSAPSEVSSAVEGSSSHKQVALGYGSEVGKSFNTGDYKNAESLIGDVKAGSVKYGSLTTQGRDGTKTTTPFAQVTTGSGSNSRNMVEMPYNAVPDSAKKYMSGDKKIGGVYYAKGSDGVPKVLMDRNSQTAQHLFSFDKKGNITGAKSALISNDDSKNGLSRWAEPKNIKNQNLSQYE